MSVDDLLMLMVESTHQLRHGIGLLSLKYSGDHFTKKRASFQSELAFSFTTVCRKLASFSKKLAGFLGCFTKLLAFCDPENM